MSELKAYRIKGVTLGDFHDVYIKAEADKVIADLEESHKMEVEQLLIEIAELKKEKEYVIEHTAEVINGQEKVIAELKEERRWRKCSDELPDDGAEVLATDGDGIWFCYKTTMSDGSPWFQPDGIPHIEGITHWMPLPEKQKEGE